MEPTQKLTRTVRIASARHRCINSYRVLWRLLLLQAETYSMIPPPIRPNSPQRQEEPIYAHRTIHTAPTAHRPSVLLPFLRASEFCQRISFPLWTGGIGNLATPVLMGVHYPLWQIMGCLRFKRSRFPRFPVGLWRGTPCPFVDLSALNRLRGSSRASVLP